MKLLFMAFMALFLQSTFACGGAICRGNRVNFGDRNEYVGTVMEVFSNSTIKIDVDGQDWNAMQNISRVGKGIKCNQGVCQYKRVNFGRASEYFGTVKEVFTNGIITIDVDNYDWTAFQNVNHNVGLQVNCSSGICETNRVNFFNSQQNYTGSVIEVFSNGIIHIDVDGQDWNAIQYAHSVGASIECSRSICMNDRVIFDGYTGTVSEIFKNGIVTIDVDNHDWTGVKYIYEIESKISCDK